MKLHVFNPEHDIVMAYGDGMFTSPHAARGLRRDLGFIPAFTAKDGDFVLVDDIAFIVNVPSKTVVTAMDQAETNSNVFTNIDGAVIM